MKWRIEMDGEGSYWWKAETPLGPVYAMWRATRFNDRPVGWFAVWHPYDSDVETQISAGWNTEDTAKDEAEKWIRDYARKVAKKLARFAK
jgi:hypothetical protein